MNKRMLLCAVLCVLLTGCNVPQADPEHESLDMLPSAAETSADTTAGTSAETQPRTDKIITNSTKPSAETLPTETDAADNTETTETQTRILPWQTAYQTVLQRVCRKSEHEASYFALIQLNSDTIPELVILDGIEMSLYCCREKKAVLLLEDAYKDNAVDGQNVCYQPKTGMFSTAFSTMGAGSGFTIFIYDTLEPEGAERLYFDNMEDEGGDLPYNDIWDKADEFEITNNGYHDVTLGESWVHIGTDFGQIWELTEENIETIGADWDPIHQTTEETDSE